MTDRWRIGSAVSWSAADLLLRNGLNVVILIVLARLLSPSDFGLMAMLGVFVMLATVLVDSGFSQALIQRQDTTHADESTIFFFTLGMGLAIALLLGLLAPWIAEFYQQPILRGITWCMALNLLISSVTSIHTTLLTKALDFKTLAKANVIATVVAGVVALIMAFYGYGVWSLVGQALAFSVATMVLLWTLHPWRPLRLFKLLLLRRYFNFGGYLLWSGLLYVTYKNLYALLIGKLHSVADAGYYDQARRLQQVPIGVLSTVVGRVSFPVFSRISSDKHSLQVMLSKAIAAVMFITVPLMFGLFVLAEPLVLTILGQKWLPMVPVLAILAVAGLVTPLNQLNINVLKAQGHAALNAKIQLIRLGIGISLLLLTSPYGIVAVAYGQVLASWLSFFVNTYYTRKHLQYGAIRQLHEVLPYFAISVLVAVVVKGVELVHISHGLIELLASMLVGCVVYVGLCRLIRLKALAMVFDLLKRK